MEPKKVTRQNGQFQQWQALLTNRTKRTQGGKFFVQGVRPINAAIEQQLVIDSLLYRSGKLSDWATQLIANNKAAKQYEVSPDLMKELGEKNQDAAEVLLLVKTPRNTLGDVASEELRSSFILALDRPQNPGNIGAIVRSADALGAAMVVVTGHAADIYDPKSVRASRGSLFALPIVVADSPAAITEWLKRQPATFAIVGLSEDGNDLLWDFDLTKPTLAVIGNETWGLSKQWRDICTNLAAVPMYGTASSLNAASSAAITLYEYSRQLKH
jgi:23S rRNA (uridine2479-2'-O)-methyltransferase